MELKAAIFAAISSRPFSSDKKTKCTVALLKIVYGMRSSLNPTIISNGYRRCGMHPIDYGMIVSNCKTSPTVAQSRKMYTAFDEAVLRFRQDCQLTEQFMNQKGIPTVSGDRRRVPHDQRAIQHQRAAILTDHRDATNMLTFLERSGIPRPNTETRLVLPRLL